MAANAGERALAAASQLEKIKFVDFTVDLVKGVYEVIVKASMDQLQSYAEFVNKVSKSVEEYQAEMIGAENSDELREKVNSYIKDVLGMGDLSTAADNQKLTVTVDKGNFLKSHFSDVQTDDKKSITEVLTKDGEEFKIEVGHLKQLVKNKLKADVKHSQDLLKTILKIGMQKVVVTNGEIQTKLTFHVDAKDVDSKEAQTISQRASGWGIGGGISGGFIGGILGWAIGGRLSGGYSSRELSVSVVNEKSSAATNIQIDILGYVRIQFRTETFPSVEA